MAIFEGVRYFLPSSFTAQREVDLCAALDSNGATRTLSVQDATHVVTNSYRFEGYSDVQEGAVVVTDTWVDKSMLFGKQQGPNHYSADPAMIFSGVVACATELPPTDLEVLSAGITALGGQWRTGLTKDTTHLFAISDSPPSQKYTTAMHFKEKTGVKVLLPHWFDDAVRLGIGSLPTEEYEWPSPALLRGDPNENDEDLKKRKLAKVDGEKKLLYKSTSWVPGENPLRPESQDVWKSKRIILASSLDLHGGRRDAVRSGIERAGGLVVGTGETEEEEVDLIENGKVDVVITRWRSGSTYTKSVKNKLTIGTLAWLFHVESTGILSRPMDQLLHYPIPKKAIEGFSGHEISVTNYVGESREYLKKLITAMGATFTPSMSGKNTVLIAAYISGTKTTKARSWSIPIVNHTWLEDCFVQWRNLTVGLEKYIVFPAGVDFSKVLGERGLAREVEDLVEDEEEQQQAEKEEREEEERPEERRERGPTGTENSARDATEVEAEMGLGLFDDDGDVLMNGDHGSDDGLHEEAEEAVAKQRQKSASTSTSSKPISKAPLKPMSRLRMERSVSPESAPVQRPKSLNKPSTSKKPLARAEPSSEDEDVSPVKRPVRRLVKRVEGKNDSDLGEDAYVGEEDIGPRRSARKSRGESEPEVRKSPRKSGEQKQLKRKQSVSDIALEKGRKKAKGVWVVSEDELDDEDEEVDDDLILTSKVKGKGKAKEISDATDNEDGDESQTEAKESHKNNDRKGKPKAKPHSEQPESEEEEVVPVSKGKAKAMASSKPTSNLAKSTPKRVLSVLMPPLTLTPKPIALTKTNVVPSPVEIAESASKSSRKKVGPPKRESVKAANAEASSSVKPARGRAEPGSTSKPKAKRDISPVTPVTPAQVDGTRLLTKRAASTKASQVLKDQVVDMNHFQLELKHAKARKSAGGGDRSIDFVFDANSASHKKKRMSDTEDVDEEDERNRKKRKMVTKGNNDDEKDHGSKTKKKAVTDGTDEDSDGPVIVVKKKSAKRVSLEPPLKGGRKSDVNSARVIKLMTTQVALADDVVKALTKLGVKITTRPSECTHLIAPHLVRTEKFLCALAVAPFILTEKWATDSAAQKELLPEDDYLLRDEKNERKYKFKLSDALLRAKDTQGGVFANKSFYLTPKIPIDIKLLKNVITACGGTVITQPPTIRTVSANPDRHVISCPEDVSIWRPLSQKVPIYTQELVLNAALKQKIDWDDPAHKVPGSF